MKTQWTIEKIRAGFERFQNEHGRLPKAVLEDGELIEEGSWSALMRKRGRFRELWEKQKL
jgi:hypothetical protein